MSGNVIVALAIGLTKNFMKKNPQSHTSGLEKVPDSLEYAENNGVFWEIINGVELYE